MRVTLDIEDDIIERVVNGGLLSKHEFGEILGTLRREISSTERSSPEMQPTPEQLVDFFYYGHKIKETERRGWRLMGIDGAETVACHMYRMALMAMVLQKEGLDTFRCLQLALVHDLAESIVGDITPRCGISREQKHQLEADAMEKIVSTIDNTATASMIREIWNEYEEGQSPESVYVHSLDKLECALQAYEYEAKHTVSLGEFIASAEKGIKHSNLLAILEVIKGRRREGPSKSMELN